MKIISSSLNLVHWSEANHIVKIYDTEDTLINSIVEFIKKDEVIIIFATKEHRQMLELKLELIGLDVGLARRSGAYIDLDAKKTLRTFMMGRRPDPKLFVQTLNSILNKHQVERKKVRIFGEMMALLWDRGNSKAAIELEGFWNSALSNHSFSLLCAYSTNVLGESIDVEKLNKICDQHSGVLSIKN